MDVIIALDLGTTGNRAIAFSKQGKLMASAYQEFPQLFPKPAWVEQDPIKLYDSALKVLKAVIDQVGIDHVTSIGLTNQRETTIVWDKHTGNPVCNAIVWQCRRTSDRCQKLKSEQKNIKAKTGLLLDPYFSATKIEWILENVPGATAKAMAGDLLFGTVDTWVLWQLTSGRVHATDVSNASRTMLFNIHTMAYDEELLELFHVPRQILPEVKDSDAGFGMTAAKWLGREIPIRGILGDQQASLFAQCGSDTKKIKNTYGTGLFVVASTGSEIPDSPTLINTVAWGVGGIPTYAIEGSIFNGGSVVQWLRDGLEIISDASETEPLSNSLASNDLVYFVPALAGLGAPYWDPDARGLLIGITRATTKAHIVRAALESLAYQTKDVVEAIPQKFDGLRVDGGACSNGFLMQFQADILQMPVEVADVSETTAVGIAGLSGIASGFWTDAEFRQIFSSFRTYVPSRSAGETQKLYDKWQDAVARSRQWQ